MFARFFAFLLVLVVVVMGPVITGSNASVVGAWEWDNQITIRQDRLFVSNLAKWGHHHLRPVVIDNPHGCYVRIEIQSSDVEIDVYRVPTRWRHSSHNFSTGGSEFVGTITHPGDLVFLRQGEYIFRVRAGSGETRFNFVFGPRATK